jgi:hypothetical protein
VVGGGDGGVLRELARHPTLEVRVTYVVDCCKCKWACSGVSGGKVVVMGEGELARHPTLEVRETPVWLLAAMPSVVTCLVSVVVCVE